MCSDSYSVLLSDAGRSEISLGRCFASGGVCGFSPGLRFALCPGRESINSLRFRKPQRFHQRKSEVYFTPLKSWSSTWTGLFLHLSYLTRFYRARVFVLSDMFLNVFFRSIDRTPFQLFHPSLEDMVRAEKLFCSSPAHKIDYYTSAERLDHVPALTQPEVSGQYLCFSAEHLYLYSVHWIN